MPLGGRIASGPPTKVLWYLPIIPRFKRLFANVDRTKDLTWHADGRNYNRMLRYLTNSSQWKKINNLYPDLGKEEEIFGLDLPVME